MTITINLPFSPIILILSLVVLVNLALAWKVWNTNRKNSIHIFYALSVLMAALWILGLIGVRINDSPLLISLAARLTYFWAALIAVFFYLFTYHFPYKTFELSRNQYIILISSVIFVLFISILPNVFIAGLVLPEKRFKPEISLFWHLVYAVYFLGIMTLSFCNLFLKYKSSDGIWRRRLKQILLATLTATCGGSFFALIIPMIFNNNLAWMGPLFTVFMAGYIWYYIFWKPNRK